MKRIITPIIIAVFAAIALIIGIIIGKQMSYSAYPVTQQEATPVRAYGGPSAKFGKLNAILSLIDQSYVDNIDVDNL